MLLALNAAITARSHERTAALHKRFADPQAVTTPAVLQHALKLWRDDYEELEEVGATPSHKTTLTSLKQRQQTC